MGIPIPKTLGIWVPPSHITLAICVRVTRDALITMVLGMGIPKRADAKITVTRGLTQVFIQSRLLLP